VFLLLHTNVDLGRPIKVVTDMEQSRKLDFQATDESSLTSSPDAQGMYYSLGRPTTRQNPDTWKN